MIACALGVGTCHPLASPCINTMASAYLANTPTSQRLANQHLLPPQLFIQQHHGFVQPPPLPVSVAQQLVPHSTVPVIPSATRNQAVLFSQDHVLMLRLSQLVSGVVILLGQSVCR